MTKCAQCGDDESLLNRYDVCPSCVDKALAHRETATIRPMNSEARKEVIQRLLKGVSPLKVARMLSLSLVDVTKIKKSMKAVAE